MMTRSRFIRWKLWWMKLKKSLQRLFKPKLVQTCPRRMRDFGPWEKRKNLDTWQKRGDDLVCSFCGSMNVEGFIDIVDHIIDVEDDMRLDPSDKSYKIYIHRLKVMNAGQGAIKFYTYHLADASSTDIMELNHRVKKALEISNKRFVAYMEKVRNNLYG